MSRPAVETVGINKILFRECLSNNGLDLGDLEPIVERASATITNYISAGKMPREWIKPLHMKCGIDPTKYLLHLNKMRESKLYPVNKRKFIKALKCRGMDKDMLADLVEREPDTITRYLRRGSFPSKWLIWIEVKREFHIQNIHKKGNKTMPSMMCLKAVNIIYANVERLGDLRSAIPYSEAFEQMSYSRFAAFEIVRLLSRPDAENPIMIIENFIEKMDRYSLIDSDYSWPYSCMYDSATNILDLVLGLIGIWEWY